MTVDLEFLKWLEDPYNRDAYNQACNHLNVMRKANGPKYGSVTVSTVRNEGDSIVRITSRPVEPKKKNP